MAAQGHLEAPARPAAPAAAPLPRRRVALRVGTAQLVGAVAVAYGVVFAAAAVLHHLVFGTARLDLGDMTQAVWNTAHGRFLEVSDHAGHTFVRLGAHVDPFLALLAPLWWIWPSPVMLLVLQALVVATGALPVFWLARKHLGSERAGVHLALAYLVYPATQWNAYTPESSFHPASFAIPLVLFALWYLDEERLLLFSLFGLLAATTKEQMPLVVGMLGLWYAVSRRRLVPGLPIFATGFLWTGINFLVVLAHFAPGTTTPFADRYEAVGGSPLGILRTAFTDPGAVLSSVATGHKLLFVGLLAAPLLGLWALAPVLAAGALPELVIDLLSSEPNQTTIFFHYTAGVVPFLFAATVFGMRRWRGNAPRLSLYVFAATASVALLSPLLISVGDVSQVLRPDPVRRAQVHAIALVPPAARVSASNKLGGHLAERRHLLTFPHLAGATWAVVDRADTSYRERRAYIRSIAAVRASRHWQLVFSSHGVSVFRRASS